MPKDRDGEDREWVIGQVVRVRLSSRPGAPTCRATILTVDESSSSSSNDNGSTVDVLYEDGVEWAEGKEEEEHVRLNNSAFYEGRKEESGEVGMRTRLRGQRGQGHKQVTTSTPQTYHLAHLCPGLVPRARGRRAAADRRHMSTC